MSELISRTYRIKDKGEEGYTDVTITIDEEAIFIKQHEDDVVMPFEMAKEFLKLLTSLEELSQTSF